MTKNAILLVNVGTPSHLSIPAIRRYLREFLTDPRVIDIGTILRSLLVYGIILPFRPRRALQAYRKIWTPQGSPLAVYTEELAKKIQAELGEEILVRCAMRYQEPSLRKVVRELCDEGVENLVILPLFPQYSSAAWGSVAQAVMEGLKDRWNVPAVSFVPPFYNDLGFIDCFANKIAEHLKVKNYDRILFSFHGLPERHCLKTSLNSSADCTKAKNCCEKMTPSNRFCYRAQCFATARKISESLSLPTEQWEVCFQSRLGRTPWIKPYTDELINELAAKGVSSLLVVSPSFVADCLETLEEIQIRAHEQFIAGGGKHLDLVLSLNVEKQWVAAVLKMIKPHLR